MAIPARRDQGRLDADGNGSVALRHQQGDYPAVDLRERRAHKTVELEQARKRFEIRCLACCRRFRWNLARACIAQQLGANKAVETVA
jgi:hypothetical protein